MEKKKAILKIESYSSKDGMLLLSVSDYGVRAMLKGLVELCNSKYSGYIKLDMSPPYKPRTTQVGGQNRKIWGMIHQICNETGYDIEDVEDYIKLRATRMGYPVRENKLTGEIKPVSMATINTVEASYLIEELYQLAAEMEIPLDESDF